MKVQNKKWIDCLGNEMEIVVCMVRRKNIIANYSIKRCETYIITEVVLWNIDKKYIKKWTKVKDTTFI